MLLHTGELDSLWLGRGLGYLGGRRTGLAFTDDLHRFAHTERWGLTPGTSPVCEEQGERATSVIWVVLGRLGKPVFLWDVFPLHPYQLGIPPSNHPHNA